MLNHQEPTPCPPEEGNLPEDVQSIMERYDREANIRIWTGGPRRIVRGALALFSVLTVLFSVLFSPHMQVWMPVFLGLCVLLGFLVFPHKRNLKRVNYLPWFDVLLMLAGACSFLYFTVQGEQLLELGSIGGDWGVLLAGAAGILTVAELCRRSMGLPIVCIAAAFLIYAMIWSGAPIQTIQELFFSGGEWAGVLGSPVRVCAEYVVLFIVFGAFLEMTGISSFFIQMSNAVTGGASGGPAKVAVIASALCGMVSGSSVGNTVTTGSVTIPMMKKAGYRGDFAGPVEAAASTGGQLMPPIMGAAAFLLADAAGVPYSDVLRRAVIPALLYFAGIFIAVHLEARKLKLRGVSRDSLPQFWPLLRRRGYVLLPLLLLIVLVAGDLCRLEHAVLISTLATVAVGLLNREDHIITWGKLLDALVTGGRNALSTILACGLSGVVVGVVSMTGLVQQLIDLVGTISNGSMIAVLVFTMLCCILLGMGVPTTANFCIMAAICVPVLIHMGAGTLPAYFFVFYFGIVADLTPPVAIAASAGAAIAGSRPLYTALNATRLAIVGFIVPYIFVLSPSMLLLETTPLDVLQLLISSMFGIFGVAAGLEGYFIRPMNWALRLLSVLGGISLIYPGTMTDIMGIVIIVVVFSIQTLQNSRDPESLSSP